MTLVRTHRLIEEGALKQALSVVKKRSGNHERAIREIKVGAGGIQVGKPLTGFQGVMTGVPAFLGGKAGAETQLERDA